MPIPVSIWQDFDLSKGHCEGQGHMSSWKCLTLPKLTSCVLSDNHTHLLLQKVTTNVKDYAYKLQQQWWWWQHHGYHNVYFCE